MAKAIELGIKTAAALGSIAYNYYKMPKSTPMPARRVATRRMRPSKSRFQRSAANRGMMYRRRQATQILTLSGGRNKTALNISLNNCFTSDLQSAFDLYRIRKCVVEVIPQTDSDASSSITNTHVTLACDPTGAFTTSSWTNSQDLAQFDNYAYQGINQGRKMLYTFYPKVINTVDIDGIATGAGNYATNPWLNLNSTGVTIPHKKLLIDLYSSGSTAGYNVNITVTVYFECKSTR